MYIYIYVLTLRRITTVMCEVLICVERWNAKEPLHTLQTWDWILCKPVPIQQQNILLVSSQGLMLLFILPHLIIVGCQLIPNFQIVAHLKHGFSHGKSQNAMKAEWMI